MIKPILISLALGAIAFATPAFACRSCQDTTGVVVYSDTCASCASTTYGGSGTGQGGPTPAFAPEPPPKTPLDKAQKICHEHAGGSYGNGGWSYPDDWQDCKKIDAKVEAVVAAKGKAAEEAEARRESPLKEFVTAVANGRTK